MVASNGHNFNAKTVYKLGCLNVKLTSYLLSVSLQHAKSNMIPTVGVNCLPLILKTEVWQVNCKFSRGAGRQFFMNLECMTKVRVCFKPDYQNGYNSKMQMRLSSNDATASCLQLELNVPLLSFGGKTHMHFKRFLNSIDPDQKLTFPNNVWLCSGYCPLIQAVQIPTPVKVFSICLV